MNRWDINQIIDLDRFPIDDPQNSVCDDLIEQGRKALESRALFSLEQFLRPQAITSMADELRNLLPVSCRYEENRNAYTYDSELDEKPDGHPMKQLHPCKYNQVLNYQIPNDSLLRQVYYWQPLTDFLRRLSGYESFYRSDCPQLALSSKIAGEGDTDGWHFDSNDIVFSILLQAAEAGGEFEYAPYIRSETDENFTGISELTADPQKKASRPGMGVGNLTVFKGDLSMHRVTPVIGQRQRIVALFCYDREPGTSFAQSYINELTQNMGCN